jgi:release factor H-coupled RctB family protein
MPQSPNITVLDGPDVWMEGEALLQLERVASHPACVRAAGMPDLHPGPGTPIGATVALRGTLWPALLGGDLGCGVKLFGVPKVKHRGDALLRRMDDELTQDPLAHVDAGPLMEAVWTRGPSGLRDLDDVPDSLRAFAELEHPELDPVGPTPPVHFARQLGTVGGGNHFLELSRVHARVDAERADGVGLRRGGFAVLAHSGSRALGKHLAGRWGGIQLAEEDAGDWLAEVRGAVNYARTNRLVLCWRMLRAAGVARPSKVAGSIDLSHNTVERAELSDGPAWLHRKGSAPAHAGQLTVVLGSRGAPTWVMAGHGSEACLCSVAHGAGRKLDRARTIALVKHRHTRASLRHTALGGRVMCDDTDALYAEHPDAYKAIEPVVAALETAGAASRVASLHPVLTVKR